MRLLWLLARTIKGELESLEEDYRGLFWRRPVAAIVMSLMMLSLAGVPITLGFIGKTVCYSCWY